MKSSALAYVCLSLVSALGGCADPECADGQQKVGAVCVKRTRSDAGSAAGGDGGNQGGEEDAPETASRRDGGFDASGATSAPPDGAVSSAVNDAAVQLPVSSDAGTVACEALACTPGDALACTTACGSTGSAVCPEQCSPDTAPVCTPPTEACNGSDDDCDGVVDGSLYERRAGGARVWTSPVASTTTSTAVLPRTNGGFWLLHRSQTQGPIELHQLDKAGKAAGKVVALDRTNTLGNYIAAGDGKWIAVAIAGSAFGKLTTVVQLYRADDASFVSELEFADDRTSCGAIQPTALAVVEDGAALRLAIGRSRVTVPLDANGQCPLLSATGFNELFFATFSQPGGWSAPVPSGLRIAAAGLFSTPMKVMKLPCRDEWLAAYADTTSRNLRRYSYAGAELGRADALVSAADAVTSIAAIGSDCSAGVASVAVAYSKGIVPEYRAYVRRLQVETSSGTVVQQGADLSMASEAVYGGQLTSGGGKAFFAGLDGKWVPRMFEVTAASSSAREIAIKPIGSASSALSAVEGQRAVALAASLGKTVAVMQNAGAVVLSVSTGGFLSGLEAAREPGDNNAPVALTYRIGCPD